MTLLWKYRANTIRDLYSDKSLPGPESLLDESPTQDFVLG